MKTEVRNAARALVLSPQSRMLLMKFQFPWREAGLWITPGGSLNPGETARDAAKRELREETGLQVSELGPEIWTREHDLSPQGRRILQRERYFLVRVDEFEPRAAELESGEEADWFRGFRWWPLDEVPDVSEDFAPRRIGQLVRKLLRDRAPEKPFAIPV